MRLSEHFWLDEFTVSETADRLGISNAPTAAEITKLEWLANEFEFVRTILGGVPIVPNSVFRSRDLNCAIGGAATRYALIGARENAPNPYVRMIANKRIEDGTVMRKNSQHTMCEAIDFKVPSFGSCYQITRKLMVDEGLRYDQLIYEYSWVHISFAFGSDHPRREVLTKKPGMPYMTGLVA